MSNMVRCRAAILATTCLIAGTSLAMAADGPPKAGGKLVVGMYMDTHIPDPTKTIDLSTHSALKNVCENLVTVDEDYNIIPQLADKWVEEDGGKSYLFTLRKGVKFHNGKELQAEDVKYSLERQKAVASNKGDYADMTGVEVVDPYSVRISLKGPSPVFLTVLVGPFGGYIIPKDLDKQQSGEITKPVCTGPYEWVEWQPDRQLILRKFPGYVADDRYKGPTGFGGKRTALLDEILFRVIPDRSSRINALKTREVDLTTRLDVADFEQLKKEPKVTAIETPILSWQVIWLGVNVPPTNDLKFRQAIAAAIDYQEIVQAATDGHAVINPAFMHPTQKLWRTEKTGRLHKHDPARAKELLKQSSYKGETIDLFAHNGTEFSTNSALMIQQELAAVGIKTEIRYLDEGGIAAKTYAAKPDYQIVIYGASGRYDPDQAYYRRLHTSSAVNKYSNPAYDKIVEEARVTMDHQKRLALYDQAQQIIMDDVPMILMYNLNSFDAQRDYVKGFKQTSMGLMRFWDVWLDK